MAYYTGVHNFKSGDTVKYRYLDGDNFAIKNGFIIDYIFPDDSHIFELFSYNGRYIKFFRKNTINSLSGVCSLRIILIEKKPYYDIR